GRYESEERREQGQLLADGPEQRVKDQSQRNVTHGFDEVAGEAGPEQPVVSADVLRRRGSVARHDELGRNVKLTETARDDGEQEQSPGDPRPRLDRPVAVVRVRNGGHRGSPPGSPV